MRDWDFDDDGRDSITRNIATSCTGNQHAYIRSSGSVAQPARRSSTSHGSAPNTARSTDANGRSSQNGSSLGMAYLSGKKTLAPMATRTVPKTIAGHATSAGGLPNT